MVPTRRGVERAAADSGFGPEIVEKVARLGAMLAAIAESDVLREALVLKGGTALNLFCGRRPMRLSVDIDLNYVATSDRQEMLDHRPEIEKAIERISSPSATPSGDRAMPSRDASSSSAIGGSSIGARIPSRSTSTSSSGRRSGRRGRGPCGSSSTDLP